MQKLGVSVCVAGDAEWRVEPEDVTALGLRPERKARDHRRLAVSRQLDQAGRGAGGSAEEVDEDALVQALGAGHLAGAALDVFREEPLPASSPLRRLTNVYLAPHNANSSSAAAERVHTITIRNVLENLGA